MFEKLFTRVANKVAHLAGLPLTFVGCCAAVVIWAVSGPVFGFSDTWQLIINTSTTIITFLMVFLIQNTQNRDGAAVQAKLDELIRVSEGKNHFIGIEHLTETEVNEIRAKCEQAAKRHEFETSRKETREAFASEAAKAAVDAIARRAAGRGRAHSGDAAAKDKPHADKPGKGKSTAGKTGAAKTGATKAKARDRAS